MSWHRIKNIIISALLVTIMLIKNWILYDGNYFLLFFYSVSFLTLYTLLLNEVDNLKRKLEYKARMMELREQQKEEETKKQNERTVANITVG